MIFLVGWRMKRAGTRALWGKDLLAEEGDEVIEELALTDGIAIVMTDNLTPQADQLRGS